MSRSDESPEEGYQLGRSQPETVEDIVEYLKDLRIYAAYNRDCFDPQAGGENTQFNQLAYWQATYGCATIMLNWIRGDNHGHGRMEVPDEWREQ